MTSSGELSCKVLWNSQFHKSLRPLESVLVHNAGRAKCLGFPLHFSSVPTDQAVTNGKEALSGVI